MTIIKKDKIMSSQIISDTDGVGAGFEAVNSVTKMPRGRKFLTGLLCVFTVIVFVLIGKAIINLSQEPESKKRPFNTLAVMAAPAIIENVQLTVDVQGEASPRTEIDLVPQVGGKIVYVSPNFIEGGIFKSGETLVRIDPADSNVAVVRAQSAVAQAQQALDREKAEGDIARRDYEELGSGTPSDLALRIPQQKQAQAALDATLAELEGARLQLTRTSVRAPFAGRVRAKASDVGQFVSPGSRLGQIFSTDITEVKLALSDSDLARLNLPVAFVAKDRASAPDVQLSAIIGGQRREWSGKIMRTQSAYDTMTRALTAIVEVRDPYGKGSADGVPLAPGLFVDATIVGKTLDNAVTFPRDGLRPGNEVYVVDDKGQAEIRTVSVLDTSAQRAVIRNGVGDGELVVLSPMEKSRVSMPLKVLDHKDPKTVLVTPPEPEWMKKLNAPKEDEPKGFFARLFPKKKVDPNAIDGRAKQELVEALSADYAAILRDMSDEEKKVYRKLDSKGKAVIIKKRLADMPARPARGDWNKDKAAPQQPAEDETPIDDTPIDDTKPKSTETGD